MKNKKTRPKEFKLFHKILMETMPFKPWYFKLGKDKDPLKNDPWKSLPTKMPAKQAYRWMKAGFNVGIAATNMDPLVIIDIDDIKITPDSVMQPTLTVTSRKRLGRHYFYLTEDPRCKINIPTDSGGEVRAVWQYVVAPGSYVETAVRLIDKIPVDDRINAGYYTVENKINPTYIIYDNIPKIFRLAISAENTREKVVVKNNNENISALYKITIDDIFNIPDKKNRFPSLFHGSETGKNTSVSGDWILCWRHNCSHSALSALAVMAGLMTCQEAGWGHHDSGVGKSLLDFKDGKIIYRLWKFAKENGIIPKDDKIPWRAWLYLDSQF